jgi:hypothetical protein
LVVPCKICKNKWIKYPGKDRFLLSNGKEIIAEIYKAIAGNWVIYWTISGKPILPSIRSTPDQAKAAAEQALGIRKG